MRLPRPYWLLRSFRPPNTKGLRRICRGCSGSRCSIQRIAGVDLVVNQAAFAVVLRGWLDFYAPAFGALVAFVDARGVARFAYGAQGNLQCIAGCRAARALVGGGQGEGAALAHCPALQQCDRYLCLAFGQGDVCTVGGLV